VGKTSPNPTRTYWTQALDIARSFTIARITKCCQIMGRKEGTLTAAQILCASRSRFTVSRRGRLRTAGTLSRRYPIMQCTDIFFLRADICQLGVDQRKVHRYHG
jgi:tyrosyl-tRNA synthetase